MFPSINKSNVKSQKSHLRNIFDIENEKSNLKNKFPTMKLIITIGIPVKTKFWQLLNKF